MWKTILVFNYMVMVVRVVSHTLASHFQKRLNTVYAHCLQGVQIARKRETHTSIDLPNTKSIGDS